MIYHHLVYLGHWNECHQMACEDQFNCECRNDLDVVSGIQSNKRECINLSWLCDGFPDCSDAQDERDCFCSDDEFQCNNCSRDDTCDDGIPIYQCINKTLVNDGKKVQQLNLLYSLPSSSLQGCINENDDHSRYLQQSNYQRWAFSKSIYKTQRNFPN